MADTQFVFTTCPLVPVAHSLSDQEREKFSKLAAPQLAELGWQQ